MAEEPSIAVLVERIGNVQADVSEIKRDMATRSDQAHVDDRIRDLTGALERERAERVAALEKEASERKAVAARLQTVEDRLEARKWNVALALVGAGISFLFTLVSIVLRPLFGG